MHEWRTTERRGSISKEKVRIYLYSNYFTHVFLRGQGMHQVLRVPRRVEQVHPLVH